MSIALASRLWTAVRAPDWWAYKVPPLLATALAGFIVFGFTPRAGMLVLGALTSVILIAVYGYVLNDICDVEADRRSGRPNRMANVGIAGRTAGLALPSLGALALAGFVGDPVVLGLVGLNLLLPTAYSVPPLRLKGRGPWGALADAAGVHAVPTALVARTVTLDADAAGWTVVLFIASATGWALFLGLRGIVIHQVADRRVDALAGVSTLAASLGIDGSRRLVLRRLLPIELGCLAVFLGVVLPHAAVAAMIVALFLAIELARVRQGWTLPLFEPPGESCEGYLPLANNEIYEVWLPLGFATQLAVADPRWSLLLAAQAILFFPNLRMRFAGVRRTLAPSIEDAGQYDDQIREDAQGGFDGREANPRLRAAAAGISLAGVRVIVAVPTWSVNSVNLWAEDLVRGLRQAGLDARLLLTEEATELVNIEAPRLARPTDFPVEELRVEGLDSWGARWGSLLRTLESAAPCIYFPTYDWRHAAIVPALSPRVSVVGTLHGSDGPHAEQAARLGGYWNAAVALSRPIAGRLRRELPPLAERLATIPHGFEVPATLADKPPLGAAATVLVIRAGHDAPAEGHWASALARAAGSLRMVFVDPAPQLAATLRAGGAELLVAANRQQWLALCQRAHFVVAATLREEARRLLIEAMGHGCVPLWVGTAPNDRLVRDGDNGLRVADGRGESVLARLQQLVAAPEQARRLAAAAHATARRSGFRRDQMIEAYLQLFRRLLVQTASGAFRRTPGALRPPPEHIAGASIFPVALPHLDPRLGAFPSAEDADDYAGQVQAIARDPTGERFRAEARLRAAAAGLSLAGLRVIVAAPVWTDNGVNLWAEDLVRGLRQAGLDARLLLTEEATELVNIEAPRLARPTDFPVEELRVEGLDSWGARWGSLLRTLESAAPCIYFPTYDWRHAAIVPALSPRVSVVGTLHGSDGPHAEQAARLGGYWNAAVALSRPIAGRLRRELPPLAERLATIPHGFEVPATLADKPPLGAAATVLVIRAGHDAPAEGHWASALARAAGSLRMVFVDPAPQLAATLRAGGAELLVAANRQQWLALCQRAHFVVAATLREEARRLLIEAMGHGCVPLWVGTAPNDRLVRDGDNGLRVADGRGESVLARLQQLVAAPEQARRLAAAAHATARRSGFRRDQMIEAYLQLFRRLLVQTASGAFRRTPGALRPPPEHIAGASIFPVALPHLDPRLGAFPSAEDADDYAGQVQAIARDPTGERFRAEARLRAAAAGLSLAGLRVIVAAPVWTDNGVNLWAEDLVRGLRQAGLDARLLLTEEATELVNIEAPRLARPTDFPVEELRVEGLDSWGARWGSLLRTLESAAPCIYFPTYDWRHAAIVPALSPRVSVVGTLHGSDGPHAEQAARLGGYWNAAVALSRPIAGRLRRELPPLAERLATIPHGFEVPATLADKPPLGAAATVLVIRAGHDAPAEGHWASALARAAGSLRMVFVDPAPQLAATLRAGGAELLVAANRQQWLALCQRAHFVVAATLREEARRLLIEAMGHGCVPLWVGTAPNDRLVRDGDNGLRVADGRGESVLARLQQLVAAPEQARRLAAAAHATARRSGFRRDQMIEAYLQLFRRLLVQTASGAFRRTPGALRPPPEHIAGASIFPVALPHLDPRLGAFPSAEDADRFLGAAGVVDHPRPQSAS